MWRILDCTISRRKLTNRQCQGHPIWQLVPEHNRLGIIVTRGADVGALMTHAQRPP